MSLARDAATPAIRWGQPPHTFELRSSDRHVLDRAAIVFRPWMPVAPAPVPTRSWTVVRAVASDEWSLHAEGVDDVVGGGGPARAVTLVESLALQAFLDGPPDVLTLHAALVARAGRAIVVLGPNEAGKSTLASALWQQGFSFLGDDVVLVDSETLDARSAPRRVSLRTTSRALLGDALWQQIVVAPSSEPTADGRVFHPADIHGGDAPRAARLTAFAFLARRGVSLTASAVGRLPPAQAALALLPYTNLIRRLDAGRVIPRVAPLAAGVPAYDLRRGPLPEMIAAVERLLDGGA